MTKDHSTRLSAGCRLPVALFLVHETTTPTLSPEATADGPGEVWLVFLPVLCTYLGGWAATLPCLWHLQFPRPFGWPLCHPNIIGHPFGPSYDCGRMPRYQQPAVCVFVCSLLHLAQNVLGGRGSRAGAMGLAGLCPAQAQPQRSDLSPSVGFDPGRQDLV